MNQFPPVQVSYFPLTGGEDMVSSPMLVTPGALLLSLNYEPAVSIGYRRVDGFERYDGQLKPSEASYWLLPFTDGQITPQAGDLVESGAWSGIVLFVTGESGDYGLGNAAGTLVLFDVTGDLATGSSLTIGGLPFAVGGVLSSRAEYDGDQDSEYLIAAATARRERITAVPGSGPVRGVAVYNGDVYAWRDNAEGTAGVMHKATASGWESVSSGFPAGGKYECVVHNFYATATGSRLFGANGVGRAFMYDGTTATFLNTGLDVADDKPQHVIAHSNHLFLGYPQGTTLHSGIGDPENWDAATGGAGEIGVSDPVTGFVSMPGGILGIFTRNQIRVLGGTSILDWKLELYSAESGAIQYTLQDISGPRFLSDRGLSALQTTQAFGDFNLSTFSQNINPYILQRKQEAIASLRVKAKDQYRIFFNDGSGVIAKFRGRSFEFTRFDYGVPPYCCVSAEDADGNELLFMGADNGFVYQLDSGNSFDGQGVTGILRLPFGNFKSPQYTKRFRKAVIEMNGALGTTLYFMQEYDYGTSDIPRGIEQIREVLGSGGIYGIDKWGSFAWGQQTTATPELYLDGAGTNMGMLIRTESNYLPPHTIHGISLHYTIRGRKR